MLFHIYFSKIVRYFSKSGAKLQKKIDTRKEMPIFFVPFIV